MALVVKIEAGKVKVDARLPSQNGFGHQLEGDGWLLWEWHFVSTNNHLHQTVFLAQAQAGFVRFGLRGNRSHGNGQACKENTG